MKLFIRVVLLAGVVALGIWLYTIFFPGPEKAVRQQLAKVARLASIKPDQGLLGRASSIQELSLCFAPEIDITFNLRGGSEHSLRKREDIIELAKLAHARFKTLQIDFLDVNVTLSADKQSATVNLTAKVNSPEETDFQVQEFKFTLKKVDGQWLIFQIETIRTLSHARSDRIVVAAACV